jgi:nicotinamide-nucleotide amidase
MPKEESHELAIRLGTRTVAILGQSEKLVQHLADRSLYVTSVESCSGGALAHFITSISGSSEVLMDSFVTYSNQAKIALGVPVEVIEEHTVYSSQTAIAMARAGLRKSVHADIGIGITGSLSRVDPNNANSIPGEVYMGLVYGEVITEQKLFIPEPNRMEAKLHIVECALEAIQQIAR